MPVSISAIRMSDALCLSAKTGPLHNEDCCICSPFVACLGRYAKADSNIKYLGVAWGIKGGSRTGASGARPPFEKKNGTFFYKFSVYIRKNFDFSRHVVFTICILFTTLLTKT